LPEVNERIKILRKKLGMTQEEFGNRIGLSKSGISNIEKGTRGISERHIKLICTMFNTNESWLRTGEDSIKQLSKEISNIEEIKEYLQSIGYLVKVEKTGQSESGHYEDHKDDEGTIIGRSFIPDEESFSVLIIKDTLEVEFTKEEFEDFQETVQKSIEFELFKQNQKNKEKKTPGAGNTKDQL
jgi:transcriptional regulator with XRE-family HTH domain